MAQGMIFVYEPLISEMLCLLFSATGTLDKKE